MGVVVSSGVVCGKKLLQELSFRKYFQKALGMLPEDGNVMPKHVRATVHN
jgi:hypothetical protein